MPKWIVKFISSICVTSDQCKFTDLPNIPIRSIELELPTNKVVCLEGFEQYLIISTFYHFIKGGKNKVFDTINILGKKNNDVCQLSFHRKGRLFQCKNEFPTWKPLILEPKTKKSFEIKYSKALPTKLEHWRNGVSKITAKVYVK
jgi:hypothetical protein